MAVTQDHIDAGTPVGATLVDGGATFRAWAPSAEAVYVLTGELAASRQPGWTPRAEDALLARPDGTWAGFVAGVAEGDPYRFWVVGSGSAGYKRDPHARELGTLPAFPDCDCIVRSAGAYPWHDGDWRPPDFRDLIVYQLHIGTYYSVDAAGVDQRALRPARFLDLLFRLEYLRELGVNAIEPLPIQEFPSQFSMGYNGVDYYAPEMEYQVTDAAELPRYLEQANRLLAQRGQPPLEATQLSSGPDQLRCVVDLFHLNGMAVVLDVVYNHAGGGFDDQSLYFFDRRPFASNEDSLYFSNQGWAGGLVFAYWNGGVRDFLAGNAEFFLREYHVDGFRYDEVTVIDRFGGWSFAQQLTGRVRAARPGAIQIAEYWNDARWLAVARPPAGMGFDAAWSDRQRSALRGALGQAAGGAGARVDMDAVAQALFPPPNFPAAWAAVQFIEDHDTVYADHVPQQPRIPRLADASDPRSWYARSRSRVALGLLLTAPGIPMLFMGQEMLEDRCWSDNPDADPGTFIAWDALATDPVRQDYLACARDLLRLRRGRPALRGEGVNPFHVHDDNRVLAVHRWLEGSGQDLVVVASLSESSWLDYRIGFPWPGPWREIFNSDFYDGLPNPRVVGNGGGVLVDGPPLHGFGQSAAIVIPANGLVVFARE